MTIHDQNLDSDAGKDPIKPPVISSRNQQAHIGNHIPTPIFAPRIEEPQETRPRRYLNMRSWLMILAAAGVVTQLALPHPQKPVTIVVSWITETPRQLAILEGHRAELVKTRETLHQKIVEYNDLKAKCGFTIFLGDMARDAYRLCMGAVGINYESQIRELQTKVMRLEGEIRNLGG